MQVRALELTHYSVRCVCSECISPSDGGPPNGFRGSFKEMHVHHGIMSGIDVPIHSHDFRRT